MEDSEYIRELLEGLDPEKIKEVLKGIAPEAKTRRSVPRQSHEYTSYMKVVKHEHCASCGSNYTVEYKLPTGETTSYVDKDGNARCIKGKANTEIEVDGFTTYCSSCHVRVRMMGRDELERRYLDMLRLMNVSQVQGLWFRK